MLARFISTCTVSIVTLCFWRLLASWVGFSLLVLVSRKQFGGEIQLQKARMVLTVLFTTTRHPISPQKSPQNAVWCLIFGIQFWIPKGAHLYDTPVEVQPRAPWRSTLSKWLWFTSKSPADEPISSKARVPVPGHPKKDLQSILRNEQETLSLVDLFCLNRKKIFWNFWKPSEDFRPDFFFCLMFPSKCSKVIFFHRWPLAFLPQTTGFCESFPMRSSLDVPSVGGPHSRIGMKEIFSADCDYFGLKSQSSRGYKPCDTFLRMPETFVARRELE